jgi:Protein tyrosine and serine/threonine kinase
MVLLNINKMILCLAMRYMAPEVGLKQPYNLKADVYSWSMVFWYIMALEPPMGMYTPNMFLDRVFMKQYRPVIYDKWSSNIGLLMKQCWNHNIHKRPNFRTILTKLRMEIKVIDPNISSLFNESSHSSRSNALNQTTNSNHNYDNQTEATIDSSKC